MNLYYYALTKVGMLGNERAGTIITRVLEVRQVGTETGADILKQMKADSECGAMCARAIDHACDLCGDVLNAFGIDHPEMLHTILTFAVDCCVTFIRG